MDSYARKATIAFVLITILTTQAMAAFSIEKMEEPHDYQVVSPNSKVAQLVKLEDQEGDPVNKSRLDNNSFLSFHFNYNGTDYSMNHMKNGYYYAMIPTNSTGREVMYELEDQSPTGEGTVNKTEKLNAGNLDIDILTNFTSDLESGKEIRIEARVDDLSNYKVVDVDDSGGLTPEDEYVLDKGGQGTYSSGPDTVLAGNSPENKQDLSSSANWNNEDYPLAVNDSVSGDSWNGGADIIIIDYQSGGTVSTEADKPINNGSNSEIDAQAGAELKDLNSIRNNVFFVSSDNSLDKGEDIVFDNDSDRMYTDSADRIIAGNEPNEGTSITHQNTLPDNFQISSFDANNGDSWNEQSDVIAQDFDNDSQYTAREDNVLAGIEPAEKQELAKNDVVAWRDGSTGSPTQGDVEVHDSNSGDAWDPENDAIWLESGASNGYDSGQDTPLAGTPTDGMTPTESINLFDQWDISAYDGDTGDTEFDLSEDSIIRDYNSGGTYSSKEDFIIAGSITPSFTGGTDYTSEDSFDSDWTLDVIEPIPGGSWSSNQDTILIDQNDGGTYSANSDTIINDGGNEESTAGTSLQQLSSSPGTDKMWVDNDEDGMFSPGDEIFVDLDKDGIYTNKSDKHLAGISLSTAGAGMEVKNGNPWSGNSQPVLFYDGGDQGGKWNSSTDAIIRDEDSDGKYTGVEDKIVSDEEGQPESRQGDTLMNTDRTNFTLPNVFVRLVSGSNVTEPVELGKKPSGKFTNTVEIPDISGSKFLVQVNAEKPRSNIKGAESRVLSTRVKGIGFDVEETELSFTATRKGTYKKNVTVQNLFDTTNEIDIAMNGNIANVSNVSDEKINLQPYENRTLEFEFDIDKTQSYSGEIVFTENSSGKQDSVDVHINAPNCLEKTSVLCVQQTGWINVTATERENMTQVIDIKNIGPKGEQQDVTVSVSGDVSSYLTTSESFTLSNNHALELTYQPEEPGNFTGTITLTAAGEDLQLNTGLNSNVKELQKGLKLDPSAINLGAVPKGEKKSKEITISNTGTLKIENISLETTKFNIEDKTPEEIAPGTSKTFTITLKDIQEESGSATVKGQTSKGNVSEDLEISLTLVKPVSKMKEKINSRISNLRRKATGQTMTQLTNLQTKISQIETQWDKGNYQQAQTIYESTLSNLDSIERKIKSNTRTEQNKTRQRDTGRTGNTGNTGNTGTGNTGSKDSGGGLGGIIIVAVILLIVLGIGFVLYTSYYPEEGDPLYEYLGEENR